MSPQTDYYRHERRGPPADIRGLLQRQVACLDLVRRFARPPAVVLDAGCGAGDFLQALAGVPGVTAWGLDASPHEVTAATARGLDVRLADLEQGLPCADGSVDVVHAAEVIEHLYSPDDFLDECRRVLAPGGVLVLSTPNLHAWYNRLLFACGALPLFYEVSARSTRVGTGRLGRLRRDDLPVGHIRVLNRRALLDLLDGAGFDVVAERAAHFSAFPRWLRRIDSVAARRPSLGSVLVVAARRR